jgi:hypothetical protein
VKAQQIENLMLNTTSSATPASILAERVTEYLLTSWRVGDKPQIEQNVGP